MSEPVLCVAGWHWTEQLYARLASLGLPVYVVSHRCWEAVPEWLGQLVPRENLLIRPNVGYDWGCYQQFIESGLWRGAETVFFLHDDVVIRDGAFVDRTLELLRQGARVVGNGRNSAHRAWPRTHPVSYAHSGWLPPSPDYEHDTVRGSFFAMPTEAIARMGRFEVFWDPFQVHMRFGNHSLRATCGKAQNLFGDRCFAFLAEEYRSSPYIYEEERPGDQMRLHKTVWRRALSRLYHELGTPYATRLIGGSRPGAAERAALRLARLVLAQIDGVEGVCP